MKRAALLSYHCPKGSPVFPWTEQLIVQLYALLLLMIRTQCPIWKKLFIRLWGKRSYSSGLESGAHFAVLDIPLLFETSGDKRCDLVAVVTAPADVQRARVLARPGMGEATFEAILSKQMSDSEKRAKADFVISTAFGFDFTRAHVEAIIDLLNREESEND
jgi:dephospho-CoA kinase